MSKSIYTIGPAGFKKELVGLLRDNARRHRLSEVFRDFCELLALAFSNACDKSQFEEREERYLQIIKRYERPEVIRFVQMREALTNWMECVGQADCLGELFMALELGDSFKGQFFTPYSVSKMMAAVAIQGVESVIAERGFVRVSEPTSGAGGMVIAAADVLAEQGFNYQRCMHVVAQDIDLTAVHMTYVQLTLLHIPAVVIWGNTLAMESRARWYTPAHILGGWGRRLAADSRALRESPALVAPVDADQDGAETLIVLPEGIGAGQMALF